MSITYTVNYIPEVSLCLSYAALKGTKVHLRDDAGFYCQCCYAPSKALQRFQFFKALIKQLLEKSSNQFRMKDTVDHSLVLIGFVHMYGPFALEQKT